MKPYNDKRNIGFLLLLASLLFFILGFMFPLLQTGYRIGPLLLKQDRVYLWSSFQFFFNKGEMFVGVLLLFFTIIFPSLKYIFLLATLSGFQLSRHTSINTLLEIVNKWAMLDVFVVAVLILNMKFDSSVIVSRLEYGTTLFAISVVLMMACSAITGKWLSARKQAK